VLAVTFRDLIFRIRQFLIAIIGVTWSSLSPCCSPDSRQVFRLRGDGTEEHLAEIGPGNYVGELGPILNLPRSASVRAIESSTLTGYTVLSLRRQFPDAVPGKAASRPSHLEASPK
jgi:Cyclic nucleotide-binding domain